MSLGAQLSIQLLEHRCLSWAGNVFSMLKEMLTESFFYCPASIFYWFSPGFHWPGRSFADAFNYLFGWCKIVRA